MRMPLSQWSFMDFLFILIILISVVFALLKGLARELISLTALIGGPFFCYIFRRKQMGRNSMGKASA